MFASDAFFGADKYVFFVFFIVNIKQPNNQTIMFTVAAEKWDSPVYAKLGIVVTRPLPGAVRTTALFPAGWTQKHQGDYTTWFIDPYDVPYLYIHSKNTSYDNWAYAGLPTDDELDEKLKKSAAEADVIHEFPDVTEELLSTEMEKLAAGPVTVEMLDNATEFLRCAHKKGGGSHAKLRELQHALTASIQLANDKMLSGEIGRLPRRYLKLPEVQLGDTWFSQPEGTRTKIIETLKGAGRIYGTDLFIPIMRRIAERIDYEYQPYRKYPLRAQMQMMRDAVDCLVKDGVPGNIPE